MPLAQRQWQQYVDALRHAGWRTSEVPPAPDCPDSVFIEDMLVAYKDLVVIARPGAVVRRPETVAAEQTVRALGCSLQHIQAPGTLDGGDVLKVGDTVYVGLSGRTNAAGIEQLRVLLEPRGAKLVVVPLTKALHLKSAVTALPGGTLLGWQPAVDDPRVFPNFLAAPEPSGAHVVLLDDKRLLMSANCPRSVDLVAARGFEPVPVDISEFEKLEGCVTCLSVRLRGLPA